MKDFNKLTDRFVRETPKRWGEATLTILVIVGLFAGIGYLLDGWFGTRPVLFIILIVLAFPVSQYLIYVRLKKQYLDNGNHQ